MFPGSQPPQKPQLTTDNSNVVQQNLLYNIALQQQITNVLSTLQQPVCMASLIKMPATSSSNSSTSVNPLLNILKNCSNDQRQFNQQSNLQLSRVVNIPQNFHYVDCQSNIDPSKKRPSLMSNFVAGSTAANIGDSTSLFQSSEPKTFDSLVSLSSNLANDTDNVLDKTFVSNLLHNDNSSTSNNFFQSTNFLLNNQQIIESSEQNNLENLDFDLEDESIKKLINERIAKIDKERYLLTSNLKAVKHKVEMCNKIISRHEKDTNLNESEDELDEELDDYEIELLIDKVYTENKKHLITSSKVFSCLTDYKINKNTDQENIEETFHKSLTILPILIKAMRLKKKKQFKKLVEMQEEYNNQLVIWQKKVLKFERNPKKIARDVKHREIFEKTFVELKKQREEKDRSNRLDRLRTNNENNSGENSQNIIDSKARAVALISPLFYTVPIHYCNYKNGSVKNALFDARNRLENFLNIWTESEKEIFEKKIIFYGKNFAAIAAFLLTKSVRDCVLFYYLTKKINNYKLKFGRKRKKIGRQYRPPVMPHLNDIYAEEGYNNQHVIKNGIFTECLMCNSKMNIFSFRQNSFNSSYIIDNDLNDNRSLNNSEHLQNCYNQMPICVKCINITNKNKTANRCPIGTCSCGKRKAKPIRAVPEKFFNLSIEYRRFLVYRIRIPPSANKCCTVCYKKIVKDIEAILDGSFKNEIRKFNEKMTNIDSRIIKPKIQQNKETIIDKKNLLFGNIFLLNLAPNISATSSDISLKNYEITNEIKIEDKIVQNDNKNFEDLVVKSEICVNENQTNISINQENNFTKEVVYSLQQPISTNEHELHNKTVIHNLVLSNENNTLSCGLSNDIIKRKSGLATAILPTLSPSSTPLLNSTFSCTLSNNSTPSIIGITQKSLKGNENFTTTSSLYSQNYFSSKNNNLISFTSDIKYDNHKITDTFSSTSIIQIPENSLINTNKNIALLQNSNYQSDFNLNKSQCYQEKIKTVVSVNKSNVVENPDLSTFDSLDISKITTTTNSLDVITSTLHNSISDDLLRSSSVKAESNCGGVSSSCYESLSDDSDDYENTNQKNFNIMQPSSSSNKTLEKSSFFFKHDKSDNESQEEETLYLNVLTMNLPLLDVSTLDCDIEQKNIQLDIKNTSNHENINICNEDIGQMNLEQNLCFKVNNLPTATNASSTTCIYEPLSDDDIF